MELSIVIATSNNDYGNKIYRDIEPAVPTPEKERARYSIFTLREAFRNFDYEIIMVEWNPKPNRYRLYDWEFLHHPRIRIITVPAKIAATVTARDYHEMHAKNVGIRRARGDMILAINPDCLWLDQVYPNALERVRHRGVMIANRTTVYHNVLECGLDLDRLRNYCRDPHNMSTNHDMNSNGDFTMMSKTLWHQLRGYSTPEGNFQAGLDMWQVERANQLGEDLHIAPFSIFHIRHPGAPLDSGYGKTVTSDSWGLKDIQLEEFCDG
jgi:hypothetical protein